MTTSERRELLLQMLEANEKIEAKNTYSTFIYSNCLLQLCDSKDYKHATAIISYEREKENAQWTEEQYWNYVHDLEKPDSHSEKLHQITVAKVEFANTLEDSSNEGYDYFLGIFNEERGSKPSA